MMGLIIVLLVLTVFLFLLTRKKKQKLESVEPNETVVFGKVYNFYKNNGYLDVCKKNGFKFSSQRLDKIMSRSQILPSLAIQDIKTAKDVPDVGTKVYQLIDHLVTKYVTEN